MCSYRYRRGNVYIRGSSAPSLPAPPNDENHRDQRAGDARDLPRIEALAQNGAEESATSVLHLNDGRV